MSRLATGLRRPAAACWCALVLAVSAAPGQDEDPRPQETFGAILDVRVVNVEVVVTDRDGVPVRGLAAGDFTLEVDGAATPIEYFSEVRAGVALDRLGETPPDLASVPAVSPGAPVGTSYLLFIDDLFSIDLDRNEILDALASDLALLGPEDRMAIVAFDGRELTLLSSWSGSGARLERALATARERPSFGMQRLVERRRFEGVGGGVSRTRGFPRLSPEAQSYVLQLSDQVERVVRAATLTLRGFAQPPGRKVMMLLSGGWPYRTTDYVTGDRTLPITEDLGIVDGAALYDRLTGTANSLGYTLYPVNVPGSIDRLGDPTSSAAAQRRQEVYGALDYLARETGGRALLGVGRERVLSRTVGDTRSYYWLGFTPDRAWDDRVHDIRVRLSNPDLEVRSRSGFRDVSRQAEVTMAVESALFFDDFGGDEGMVVELGTPSKSGFRKVTIPVRLDLPLDGLTFLPQGDRWVASVELRFALRDEGFHQAETPVVPLVIESPVEPARGARWSYATELRVRRRPQEMMVAVYDAPSGRILTRRVALDP